MQIDFIDVCRSLDLWEDEIEEEDVSKEGVKGDPKYQRKYVFNCQQRRENSPVLSNTDT
jgi:hypothetical protein